MRRERPAKLHAGSQFRCAVCGHVYAKGMPEADAEAELLENFPGFTKEECHLVCDDCWQTIRPK